MLLEPKTFRDKIAILDERGSRRRLYPAEVSGVWRKRRTLVQLVLIAVFLILPWIKIGGHPLVLFDLVNSRFHLFGLHLWAHDVPMAFFVLGLATVGLALATALVGRVWCGWACPQTVLSTAFFAVSKCGSRALTSSGANWIKRHGRPARFSLKRQSGFCSQLLHWC